MLREIAFKILIALTLVLGVGCGEGDPSFSLLSDQDVFIQKVTNNDVKIDILWVIDNSGSMRTSQEALVEEFGEFMDDFKTKNYNFKMAVTTTEAYRRMFTANDEDAKFKDGTDETSHTGVFVVTPDIPNFEDIFLVNVLQGTLGTGDERAFSSFTETFDNPLNAGFVREDAFLAVILVSDEDDFSHDDSFFNNDYNYEGLHEVQTYVDYLDSLKNSFGTYKRYSVSAMAIYDEACRVQLNDEWPGRKIGVRMEELVDATGGKKGSLCDDFAVSLDLIAKGIVNLANEFFLSRIPKPETIVVTIDGQIIPEVTNKENPEADNGWLYNATNNSIFFYNDAVPQQGAAISVDFDPVSVGQ